MRAGRLFQQSLYPILYPERTMRVPKAIHAMIINTILMKISIYYLLPRILKRLILFFNDVDWMRGGCLLRPSSYPFKYPSLHPIQMARQIVINSRIQLKSKTVSSSCSISILSYEISFRLLPDSTAAQRYAAYADARPHPIHGRNRSLLLRHLTCIHQSLTGHLTGHVILARTGNLD